MDRRTHWRNPLVSATIFLEGAAFGPGSKDQKIRCRKSFHNLLLQCGFEDHMPRLKVCGPRDSAFDDFKTAHAHKSKGDYVAMWIDSEDPLKDLNAAWDHLKVRDNWTRPSSAQNDQVLFMTTCMETWITADRDAIKKHYGARLQSSALPPLLNLETRHRHDVQAKLIHATRNCANAYKKGDRSFDILGKLNPAALDQLPSFARTRRILNEKLK